MFAHWSDGIYPPLRGDAIQAVTDDGVRLHDFAAAVTSSQIFALNLFLPWRPAPRAALDAVISRTVGEQVTVHQIVFEWTPPGALLGEIDGDRPRRDEPATAVDVVLWCHDSRAARVAVLLEVKLGEGGFTNCGGRNSRGNRRRDVCASAALFFDDPTTCYLQRPWGKTRDRRYWQIFANSHGSVRAAFPGAEATGACPFAGHQQQPMRNFALAQALTQERIVDRAWFGLCAHDANPDVAEHWATWQRFVSPRSEAPFLHASHLLAAGQDDGHDGWAAWMAERYLLRLP